jgi:hypothetical protein
MKVMACGEAVVQSAFGQIKKKIHTSVVEFKGPQAASLDDIWYKKLASDSIMYISCFGFVPVKLVKIPRETGTVIVPVVVALSQIEWEFDAEVGGLFTCPRVFYKDTGSRASSFPRIYVYCIQSHTVDMCRLGPLCSSIAPYRELLEARDYTRRCNEENLKNYRFVETRSRDPPVPRAGTRPDMMSVLENTIRALPCHTNSHDDDKTEMFEPSFQKQKLVHALMSQSNGMPCVLPDDCVVSDCKHEVPQLNMAMYNQSFERSVYMALSIKGGGAPGAPSSIGHQGLPATQAGRAAADAGRGSALALPSPTDSTDEHAVLLFELETMLALFASATMDTDLAGKVQKSERDMQEGRSQRAGKRRRTRKNQKMLVDTECINILSIWVTPLVECSIKPHVSSDMSLTMKLYEEGSITKDTYSKYIKKTTGLNTAGASGKAPTAV